MTIKPHIIQSTQFKTNSIVIKFKAPLIEENMSQRAILAKLLTRITKKYPTDQSLINHLSDLYGAHLYSNVLKQNNTHVITIGIDFIQNRYLDQPMHLIEEAFKLLNEVIFHPCFDNNLFDHRAFTQEKRLMLNKFEAIKDNKGQYSFYQLLANMFKDEAYQYPSFGSKSHLISLNNEDIFQAYQSMLANDEKHIYVCGDVEPTVIQKYIEQYLPLKSYPVNMPLIRLEDSENPLIVANGQTQQARLNIGMTFKINETKDYFAFLVMNQLFGGDTMSLLFTNVREKLSLAYQIHSQVDARSGFLFVLSGVKNDQYIQAIDTIKVQFEKLQKGEFDASLLETAKRMLKNHKLESFDRPKGYIESEFSNTYVMPHTKEAWLEGITHVDVYEVVRIALTGKFHTIYCLTSEVSS